MQFYTFGSELLLSGLQVSHGFFFQNRTCRPRKMLLLTWAGIPGAGRPPVPTAGSRTHAAPGPRRTLLLQRAPPGKGLAADLALL